MQPGTGPPAKEIVLVGAGHSHLEVLRRFGTQPLAGVRLTLISREPYATYSGMLPGVVAGHYRLDDARIDLDPLMRRAGVQWRQDEMTGLDADASCVLCADAGPVPFDLLSLNTGSAPAVAGVSGADVHAIPVKPMTGFLRVLEALDKRLAAGKGAYRIAVVGGGAAGVEIALAMQYRLRRVPAGARRVELVVVTEGAAILPEHNRGVRARFMRILDERGVSLFLRHHVLAVDEAGLDCDGGRRVSADAVVWLTHAAPPAWLANTGLALDGRGFIEVNDYLQSTSHPRIFAAGDVAGMAGRPRPKSGVFAVRQGPPLWRNLCLAAWGRPLQPFIPQRDALALISCGNRYAVGSRGRWAASGAWLWYLKDWIDRRFIARYRGPA